MEIIAKTTKVNLIDFFAWLERMKLLSLLDENITLRYLLKMERGSILCKTNSDFVITGQYCFLLAVTIFLNFFIFNFGIDYVIYMFQYNSFIQKEIVNKI